MDLAGRSSLEMREMGHLALFIMIDKSFHKHSIRNKEEILASKGCICFYCKMECIPTDVVEWVDKGSITALCPNCGIDALIGDASGIVITPDILEEAYHNSFECSTNRKGQKTEYLDNKWVNVDKWSHEE